MARSTLSPLPVADTSVNEVSGRPVVLNLLTSQRSGQWTNNLLVFAGLLFGRRRRLSGSRPSASLLMSELKS
jgi:MprA protease rhombosortase-interaction domain-containing protein